MGGDVVGALYCSRDPNVAEAVAETIVKKVDKAPAPVPSDRYMYVPCVVCGQAVLDTPDHAQESHGPSFGMLLHLESLKPIVGMSMECPLRRLDANGERWCTVDRRFIERRALEQHFRMCRQRKLDTERGMAANVTQ